MGERRIVVTGTGTINPLGHTVEETWKKVSTGTCGIGRITKFDVTNFTSQVAGEVLGFDYKNYFKEEHLKTAKRLEPFVHYAEAALQEALSQSKLDVQKNPERVGICLGSGIGGIHSQLENSDALLNRGNRRVSPFFIPATIGNIASGFLSMIHGMKGPNLSMQTACATANHSIGTALMLIKTGMADAMIAGGTEATIMPLAFAGFCNMHALSTRYNETPERASRPFDKDRDGFVMGEGAGILVLEEYEHAKNRGAAILCEVLAVGMSGDAYDLTNPEPEGLGAYQSMKQAIDLAGLKGTDINYINTHGTSTPVGDVAECKAVARILEGKNENVCVGSTKSMHGHLLGATAGVEAVISIKVMMEGLIPPNLNIDILDPGITLKCINIEPVTMNVDVVLSNSFGFGGHNSSLLLRKL
ncbi:MAG: beta-ketoacyl-ACP synthase II [Spirochaetales bacterium]|nr:beta-ketoacyl-ACP synthase II [Spirochaetales bacterium]